VASLRSWVKRVDDADLVGEDLDRDRRALAANHFHLGLLADEPRELLTVDSQRVGAGVALYLD
jgi:hypothetical protein